MKKGKNFEIFFGMLWVRCQGAEKMDLEVQANLCLMLNKMYYTTWASQVWFGLICLLEARTIFFYKIVKGEEFCWSYSDIFYNEPNYNKKFRSSMTVQEFFFASFEFSPSEFKRSNAMCQASTSTDYIQSRPVHCSHAPQRTDSDCHHCTLGNNRQLRILISITITVAD